MHRLLTNGQLERLSEAVATTFGQTASAQDLRDQVDAFVTKWSPKGKKRQFRSEFNAIVEALGAEVGRELADKVVTPEFMASVLDAAVEVPPC
jgi:hypothetical protein